MGTNFYLRDERNTHVGKRSAAGHYCYDCGITLVHTARTPFVFVTPDGEKRTTLYGRDAIHYGDKNGMFKACPLCGAEVVVEPLGDSSVGRELGFNKAAPARKTGVRSCSSFSFAWYPADFREQVLKHGIVDEYGTRFTGEDFLQMVALSCPVRYWGSVGTQFS